MERVDPLKAATVHRAIGFVCNHLAGELRAEAGRRQATSSEPTASTGRAGFDPAETWMELAALTGRILAAAHDAQLDGDTPAADKLIRAALPELRRVLEEIEGAFSGEGGSQ